MYLGGVIKDFDEELNENQQFCTKLATETPRMFMKYKKYHNLVEKILMYNYKTSYDYVTKKSKKDVFCRTFFTKCLRETILKNLTRVEIIIENVKFEFQSLSNSLNLTNDVMVVLL